MSQTNFFASPDDLSPVLDAVEANMPVAYTSIGMFGSDNVTSVLAGRLIQTLKLPAGPSSAVCPAYLVTPNDCVVRVRPVTVASVGVRYAVDQLHNPDSVALTHGGFGPGGTLIAGKVGTASDTAIARRLQRTFNAAIRSTFVRVNAYWVGPEAMEHFRRGGRLTFSLASPSEFDLRLPAT